MADPSAATHPTLFDVANVQDPSGGLMRVVEILQQQNEMLMDMTVMESNEAKSHRVAIRTGLPTGVWRGYNVGVPSSKATSVNVTEEIGNYETYAVVDRDLADLNGNSAAWRLQQEAPFMEHMSQTMQQQLVYGNINAEPNGFTGFAPRYNALGNTGGNEASDNVIDGSASSGAAGNDRRSIWLICWGPGRIYGIYPKGSRAGLQVEDKGEVTLQNVPTTVGGSTDGYMEAYQTHYKWQLGLVVEDWRYAVRIANIDSSAIASDPAGATTNLPRLMFEAMEELPAGAESMNCAFYMSRDIRTKLFQQLAEGVKSSTLTIENVGGVRTHMFQGIPVRRVDKLAADENVVGATSGGGLAT